MVQIKSLMIAVIVAVAPVAQAGACTPGLDYCAATLVRYGKKPRFICTRSARTDNFSEFKY
ncbi:hypothetical protein E4U32_005365 [Claviceps aff. humidiphila group G2b]|nr:hypothetical protein E4U32_005365 [Claviceps aff. humidiphila group G2b]